MSVLFAHLFLATAQDQTKFVLELAKVGKFPFYIGQLFLQSALNRRTRLHAVPSQPQEPSDFAELESQALYAADKSECLHVAFGVSTESTLRPGRSREQRIAFVEPNRVNADTDLFRNGANLHLLGSFLEATPWSIVQSQALFSKCGLVLPISSPNFTREKRPRMRLASAVLGQSPFGVNP